MSVGVAGSDIRTRHAKHSPLAAISGAVRSSLAFGRCGRVPQSRVPVAGDRGATRTSHMLQPSAASTRDDLCELLRKPYVRGGGSCSTPTRHGGVEKQASMRRISPFTIIFGVSRIDAQP